MEKPKEECKNQQQNKDYSKGAIKYGDFTLQDLEEILEELLDSQVKTEREFHMLTGCKTSGSRKLMKDSPCNDPTCYPCSIFKKEIDNYGKT